MTIRLMFFQVLGMLLIVFLSQGSNAEAQDAGAQLAMACGSCHGLHGEGGETIPPLAGRDEAELLEQMRALKQPREGNPIMPRILRAYDEEELKALARYFAEIKP